MTHPRRPEPLLPRLPSLLAYPAGGQMLAIMAALSLFRLLANLPSLLGLLFEVAFWVMGFKLAVEALTNTAHGRYAPLQGEDVLATDGDAIEQLLLMLVVYLPIVVVAAWFGPVPALVMLALAVLFMPAAIMLLAINHSHANALNPLAWLELIGRLGGAYVSAVLVFTALGFLSALVQALFDVALPYGMGVLPGSFVALYSLVASYHLLGDLLHRHHRELGLDITPAVARTTYANPMEDETMAQAEVLAQQGQPAAAAERLAGLFRGRGASDPVHDRYRELLVAAGDLPALAAHDREYVSSLLETGKDKRALAVVADTRQRVPGFEPALPGHVARLVAQAARTGQSQLAVALAEGFEQRFPQSPELPQVVLTAATLQSERLGQDEPARQRLQAVLGRHPDHALAGEMRTLLAALERVQASGGGARAG
ncbi:tol-pal system YbgF family protein [Arenimonas sp.]|uniref:tetratricopeptide repeat protein n=1 Tax=Arenimonas sp. TaxID=1872635 RepID=UPI0035ADCC7B